MNPALTPGQRAHVDQVLSLINEVDRAWPWNEQLMGDSEVERVVLDRLAEPWQEMRSDRAYLLWAHGRAVEMEWALNEHDITRQVMRTAPTGKQTCDRCRVLTVPAGVAVINHRPHLVPLVLCATCSNHLNPDVLIPTPGGTNV